MAIQISQKIANKYCCEICHYYTSNKFDYDKHLSTQKHKNRDLAMVSNHLAINDAEKTQTKFMCKKCEKTYKDNTGLWRHKKKCKVVDNVDTIENIDVKTIDANLIVQLLKQNDDLKSMLFEQNTKMLETFQDVCKNGMGNNNNNNNHINSHNKTFNMNVFLNEHCKDAMNISEFVDSIKLGFNDLVNVGKVGYVEGISGIIIKRLRELDIYKRPMHCGDEKRHSMYIKEDGKWERDESDNKKLKKLIKQVAFRNTKNTVLFREKYPDCATSASKHSDQYNKIVLESYGGRGDNDAEKENKIIRMIAKAVYIDKSL